MRDLIAEDLYYVTAFVISDGAVINSETGTPLYQNQFYVDWCRETEAQIEVGGGLDMSSRSSGKSTIRTKAANICRLAKYPWSNGSIFSFTKMAAKKHYLNIKLELETNMLLKTVYDDIFFMDPAAAARQGQATWSRDEGLSVKGHMHKDPSLDYHSYDGQPTGGRADFICLDDVEDHKAIGSEIMLEALHRGLDATLPLLTPREINPAVLLVTNTAYSDTGLVMRYHRMLEERGDAHLIRNYPAERVDVPGNGPLGGTPQYPFTAERLTRLYNEMEDKSEYGVQFCGNFQIGEDRTLNPDWVQWYDAPPMEWGRGKLGYLCVDPSRGVKDPMCLWMWGTGADGKCHWLDASVKRLDVALPEFMNEIVNMICKWSGICQRIVQVRVEQFGQSTYAEMIEAALRQRGLYVPVIPCYYNLRTNKFSTGKRDREFEYWAPKLAEGSIVFPRPAGEGGPGIVSPDEKGKNRDLVDYFMRNEFKKFPKPVTDNMLDAGALLFEPDEIKRPEKTVQYPTSIYSREKSQTARRRTGVFTGMSIG